MKYLFVFALVLASQAIGLAAGAQSTFPDPTAFGEGWTASNELDPTEMFGAYSSVAATESFESVAGQAYWGPAGARIVIVKMTLTSTDVAIRQGWEDAKRLQTYLNINVNPDFGLLTGSPTALEGCDEVERVGGKELGSTLPVGSTLCAPNPNTILLVFAVGTVNDMTGTDASDALVQMVNQ